jgi:ferrous iron transport protein B
MSALALPADVLRIALVGNPNCGKTAIFNALTGSRQKVANYPGVTVERKTGRFRSPGGSVVDVVDLPGTYSLRAHSPDEEVTRDVVLGRFAHEPAPDIVVCVADAANLRLNLRLALEIRKLGRPVILALNMMDVAERRGWRIDAAALSAALNMPVVPTVAIRRGGGPWPDRADRSHDGGHGRDRHPVRRRLRLERAHLGRLARLPAGSRGHPG